MKQLSLRLRNEFQDKEYAHAFVDSFLNASIATQIKVLREQREWTQKKLASEAEMEQPRISVLEDVNYDKWSISTLKKLAEAFDVTLSVSFETFTDNINDITGFSRESLERLSREDDLNLEDQKESKIRDSSSYLILVIDRVTAASSKTEIKNLRLIPDSGKKEVEEPIQVAVGSK